MLHAPVTVESWRDAESVKRWQQRLTPGSFVTFSSILKGYLEWVGMGPDELIAWGKSSNDPYVVLDSMQKYVIQGLKGRRYKTQVNAYAAMRSFFTHNRVVLPQDRSFQIRGDAPPVERKLTIDNLRELIGLAAQPYRSMILVKWMGLLDTEGLIYFSNHCAEKVVQAIKEGKGFVQIGIPGRKRSRNVRSFYTFIGHDALESLREYFDRERGWPKPGESVWITGNVALPVTKFTFAQAWLRLLRKAKLIPKKAGGLMTRYGYNAHNTRDLAISLLNTVSGINPQVI